MMARHMQGHVSSDFLIPSVPRIWDFTLVKELLIPAVLIAVVGFVESTAIAKTYAAKHNYTVSANRELTAIGSVNIIGVRALLFHSESLPTTHVLFTNLVQSCFHSFPAFGSLSRSYIANKAGAATPMTCFIVSLVILVCILFMVRERANNETTRSNSTEFVAHSHDGIIATDANLLLSPQGLDRCHHHRGCDESRTTRSGNVAPSTCVQAVPAGVTYANHFEARADASVARLVVDLHVVVLYLLPWS